MIPYEALEMDYWKQPRDVCVVEEINWLNQESAEVLCSPHPKNEEWIRTVADRYGFEVTKGKLKNYGGDRFVVSTKGHLN